MAEVYAWGKAQGSFPELKALELLSESAAVLAAGLAGFALGRTEDLDLEQAGARVRKAMEESGVSRLAQSAMLSADAIGAIEISAALNNAVEWAAFRASERCGLPKDKVMGVWGGDEKGWALNREMNDRFFESVRSGGLKALGVVVMDNEEFRALMEAVELELGEQKAGGQRQRGNRPGL